MLCSAINYLFFLFLGSIYIDFLANWKAACAKKFEEENQCVVITNFT
jgi:hypothetical protein